LDISGAALDRQISLCRCDGPQPLAILFKEGEEKKSLQIHLFEAFSHAVTKDLIEIGKNSLY
jgi:hypothetical protein